MVESGPENGEVVYISDFVTLSYSGVIDAQSGVDSLNAISFIGGYTIDGEMAVEYEDGVSQTFFASAVDPSYGTYFVLARTSNLAGEYGEFQSVYSFIYTLPPTFNGIGFNMIEADGTNSEGSLSESDSTVSVRGRHLRDAQCRHHLCLRRGRGLGHRSVVPEWRGD